MGARQGPAKVTQHELDRAKRWPIGTPVTVRRDNGDLLETVTRSSPWKMGGHTWVILVGGISGGYALERVAERTE